MDIAINADYLKWRDTEGGYITQFNTWFIGNTTGHGWGETLVIESNTGLTATTAPGWSVKVIGNPWYDDKLMVQWAAESLADALKVGGRDIGEFSFLATLYVDENKTGWDSSDSLAVFGQDYAIWFGGYGVGNDNILLDSDDFGDIQFQGTLDITAVPEPATLFLFSLGLGALLFKKR